MLRKPCWLIFLNLWVLLFCAVGYAPAQIGGGPPTFGNHGIDQTSKTINFVVNISNSFSSAWVMAHNTGTGQDIQLSGTASLIGGSPDSFTSYQVNAGYASLTDGTWQLTLWARDNIGYTGSLNIESVTIQTVPRIMDHSIDQSGKTVNFTVNDTSGIASGWVVAHNSGTGQDIQLNGTVSPIMMEGGPPITSRYLVSSGYSTLADGNWQFTIWARNNSGNTANLIIEMVTIDQTPPQITFYNGSYQLSDHGTVTDLNYVKIGVTDNVDPSPQIVSLQLSGGSIHPPVPLSFNVQGGGIIPAFPSNLSPGQEYSIKLTARDATGNVGTQTVAFSYSPPEPVFSSWKYYRSDTGWSDLTSSNISLRLNTAVTISKLYVSVVQQSYDQVFRDLASGAGCTIPAGQTSCTMDVNIVPTPGTTTQFDASYIVKSQDNILASATKTASFIWDLVPPPIQISVYKGSNLLADTDAITSLSQLKIMVSGQNPQVTAVGLNLGTQVGGSGRGPQRGTVTIGYHAQDGGYVLDYPPVFPGTYSLKIWAQDDMGGSTSRTYILSYAPQQASVSSTLPAIPANVVHTDGSNPVSATLTNGGTPISGTHDVMVELSADSTTSVTLQGATIAPGEQASLPAYNFTAAKGKLDLPIQANGPGQARLQVVTNAPDSPALAAQVNFWQPQAALNADPGWGVQYLIQTQKITPTINGAPCQATMDPKEAQSADPVSAPKCLVEFTQKPAAYKVKDGILQGMLGPNDAPQVNYQVSLYNAGQKYVFGTGSQALQRLPITDVSVKATATPNTQVARKIQNLQVSVKSDGAIPCTTTTLQSRAQQYSTSTVVCLLRWTQLPSGLKAVTNDNTGALSGALDDAGDQTLALAVDLYTPAGVMTDALGRRLTVSSVNPTVPLLDVAADSYGTKIADGKFVTTDLTQGQFGKVQLKSSTAGNLILEVEGGADAGLKSYQYYTTNQPTTYGRSVLAGPLAVWQNKSITARAYYKDLPEAKTEVTINVMGVPPPQVQARLTGALTTTDTQGVPVKLQVGLPGHGNDVNYDPQKVGNWEARFGVIDRKQQFNPVTDYQDVNSGVLEATLSGFSSGSVQLAAQARLKTPDGSSEYSKEISSNNYFTSVLRGAAPQGNLVCRPQNGPAPFSTGVSLQLDNESAQVLGDVAWEISSDQGASWQPVSITSPRTANFKLARGQYLIRANMKNRITANAGYTDSLQVNSYGVPQISITGSRSVYPGSPVNLTPEVQLDGEALPADQVVVEWYNARKEKVQDGLSLSITPNTPQTLVYRVRARLKEAPDADTASWSNADTVVQVVQPRPLGAYLVTASSMEYNTMEAQNYNLKAVPVMPQGIDTSRYPVQGEWQLPDGRTVQGLEAAYSPTAKDAVKKQAMVKFVAWIDGYKDQTNATYNRALPVTTYTWPDFIVEAKSYYNMAPSSVTLTAQPVGMESYKLQKPACEWQLPPDVQYLRDNDSGGCSIQANFPNPGEFPVSVQITDARGSAAQATGTVSLAEAPECQITFNPVFSNTLKRELLNVNPNPIARCSHPQDGIVKWEFSVDDPLAQINGSNQYTLIKNLHAGNRMIHLHAETKLGRVLDYDYPLTVIPNQPPTCTIKSFDTADTRWFNAVCQDPDGRVVATRWSMNGQQLSTSQTLGVKLANSGILHFEAEDDAGAKYADDLNIP